MKLRIESLCCTQIVTFFHTTELSRATGFLYRFGQTLALVSNWHVFAGLNPLTGAMPIGQVFKPNRVAFHVSVKNKQGYFLQPMSVNIFDNDSSLWKQSPGYHNEKGRLKIIDIRFLPIDKFIKEIELAASDIAAFPAQMLIEIDPDTGTQSVKHGYPRVATDVFILGYPRGLTSQGALPVWKKGSVASEPLYPILDGAPAFFIDGLTREGMSGSPVLSFSGDITDDDGIGTNDPHNEAVTPWLLGVYSGRNGVTRDELDMTLGRAWSKAVLDDMFFSNTPGGENIDPELFL